MAEIEEKTSHPCQIVTIAVELGLDTIVPGCQLVVEGVVFFVCEVMTGGLKRGRGRPRHYPGTAKRRRSSQGPSPGPLTQQPSLGLGGDGDPSLTNHPPSSIAFDEEG